MFVAVTVNILKRKTFAQKFHLVKKSQVITNEINFCGDSFFTANILSYKEQTAEKIKGNCILPVITCNSPEVLRYKYTLTLCSILKNFQKPPSCAVLYDRNCDIIHLLPGLLAKCRSVYVFSENTEKYEKENDRIFFKLGAAAVICGNEEIPKGADFIISSEDITAVAPIFFGEFGFFVGEDTPVLNTTLPCIPDYADIYTVLAGISKFGGNQNIKNAYCEKLTKNGAVFSLKNLP